MAEEKIESNSETKVVNQNEEPNPRAPVDIAFWKKSSSVSSTPEESQESIPNSSETQIDQKQDPNAPTSWDDVIFWEAPASDASIPEEMESQESILSSSSETQVDQKEEPMAPASQEDIRSWEAAASDASIPERLKVASNKARMNHLHTNLATQAARPRKQSAQKWYHQKNEPPPESPASKPSVTQKEDPGRQGAKRATATVEEARSPKRRRSNNDVPGNEQSELYCSDPECMDCTSAKRRIKRERKIKLSKKRKSRR